MSVAIKLGQEVVWGTSSAGTLTNQGKILNISKKKSSKMTEQEDEDGETYSVIFFDQFSEVTVEVLAKSDSDVPDPGDALTVVGVTEMLVIDAEEKWVAGQTKKISISLKKWTA